MIKRISSWSFSSLAVFETCPYHAKLARIDKVPELPRPPPPNGKEHANDRGSRLHDNAEDFVRSKKDLNVELYRFTPEFIQLQHMFKKNKVELENMWCFNKDWNPVDKHDYKNTWVRIKIDALALTSPTEAAVIDYKSGKKFGNEIKHAQQCQLYQLGAFIKHPKLELVNTELWYFDLNELSRMKFTRKQGLRFFKSYNTRGLRMTEATSFPPKPNNHNCMFCPYGPKESSNKWVNKNGACKFGV